MVNAGDILIRLDPSLTQLQITEGQLFELMARRGRLEAERDGTEKSILTLNSSRARKPQQSKTKSMTSNDC